MPAALGLQMMIEDYAHSGAKMWPLVAARLACFAMASIGILATLLVAFIHPGTSLRQSRHRRHQPKSEIP